MPGGFICILGKIKIMQGFLLVCPQINGIMKCEKKEAGYEKAYDI